MTKEEKSLLIKDLCARLPYNTRVQVIGDWFSYDVVLTYYLLNAFDIKNNGDTSMVIKPYLRSISSMTEDERKEWVRLRTSLDRYTIGPEEVVDFYNQHHFDYRELIEEGLALEAPEDMYKPVLKLKNTL